LATIVGCSLVFMASTPSDAGGREVDPVIGDAVGNDEDVTVRQRPQV